MINNIIIVGLGGFLGSICRYLIHIALLKSTFWSFPMATFLANILGCLIIGIIFGIYGKSNVNISDTWLLFLTTGFCGGFTTFSTFAFENVRLLQTGEIIIMGLYISLSVFLGILAAFGGLQIAKL